METKNDSKKFYIRDGMYSLKELRAYLTQNDGKEINICIVINRFGDTITYELNTDYTVEKEYETLGLINSKILKTFRLAYGLTQAEIAEISDVTPLTVTRIESNDLSRNTIKSARYILAYMYWYVRNKM